MRLLIVTHDLADPSFRVRWVVHEETFAAAGIEFRAHEFGRGARHLGDAADVTVLHRRLFRRPERSRVWRAAGRVVFDFDDAIYHRPVPPHRSRDRAKRFFRTVAAADLVLAGNLHLARAARLRARRVLVVPSTVAPYSEHAAHGPGPFRVAWIGQRVTLPHLETVLPRLREAGLTVRVIADAAPDGVEFVPWSLDGEADALAECGAGIMPLPASPFTRGKCGYKLLQYYAAGLPAVVSPVGVNRALAAGGAFLARSPDEFVRTLLRLKNDAALRRERGVLGRDFVQRRYCPQRLGERLARILKGLAASPRT